MLDALEFISSNKGQVLNVEFIISLHKIATQKTKLYKRSGSGWTAGFSVFTPSLRTEDSTVYGFGCDIYKSTYTKEGVDEIKDKYDKFAIVAEGFKKGDLRLYFKVKKKEEIIQEMTRIIANYYSSNKTNRDIAQFAHEMDLLHPFDDGNIRVIAFLLINKLLTDEGRPSIVFQDPNIFDGFSVDQLGIFIDEEIKLSGRFCKDLNNPFNLKNSGNILKSIIK